MNPLDIIVLLSGNGSNLKAMVDAIDLGLHVKIQAVISNRPKAYGLLRAAQANIPAISIDHQDFNSRASFEEALMHEIRSYPFDFIVLAGFMRRLTPHFVQQFPYQIINIHPSLLPKYPGLNTHQQALDAGDKQHGTSVHYVTEELDAGPIIAKSQCAIDASDTKASLKIKVQQLEHQLYPQVLEQLAKKRAMQEKA